MHARVYPTIKESKWKRKLRKCFTLFFFATLHNCTCLSSNCMDSNRRLLAEFLFSDELTVSPCREPTNSC